MSQPESTSCVVVALLANLTIAGMKFTAFSITGSAAMLAETYHSVSDTGNQLLLLIGLSRSTKAPTRTHPFGHGKAQFVYGFLVSVLLFGVAGWRSVSEGFDALTHLGTATATAPAAFDGLVPGIAVSYAVLSAVIVCEGYSFQKARRTLANQINAHDWDGFTDAFQRTSDVTTLTTFVEDGIAVISAGGALAGITLSQVTGNPVYDALGAVGIGGLLMAGALTLAWVNKRLLLGKSLPVADEHRLYAVVANRNVVADVPEFRTVYFGPENVVVTARVAFSNRLSSSELPDWIHTIKTDLRQSHSDISAVYLTPEHPSPDTAGTDANPTTTNKSQIRTGSFK